MQNNPNAHPAPKSQPLSPASVEPPPPFTVGSLTRRATQGLSLPAAFVRAFFRRWRGATVCDAGWLRQLQDCIETIRQKVVRGPADSNRLQSSFNSLTEFIAESSGAALRPALTGLAPAERLSTLTTLVGFGLRKSERDLVALLAMVPPELAALWLWTHREMLQTLESRLGIPGLLVDVAPPTEAVFDLKPTYANPAMAFAQELDIGRRRSGLTLSQLAALLGKRLQHFTDGRRVPGHGPESIEHVIRLAVVLNNPSILDAYSVTRHHRDRLHGVVKRQDIYYTNYLTLEHQRQVDAVLGWDDRQSGVTRGGRRYSGGKLADGSHVLYRLYFARGMTYAQLPRHGDNPRLRGLGLPAQEVSILDLGHPQFLADMLKWYRTRQGRMAPAQSDAAFLGKMRNYFDPRDGYFYEAAEQLAKTLPPASIARCPSVWPENSDAPGTPCRTDAERIRARCYEADAEIRALLPMAQNAPPSADRLRDITPAMARFWHLLEAPLTVLTRIPRKIPRTRIEALLLQACAILAFACWRPLRIGDYANLRLSDVIVLADGRLEVRIHPWKNRGSRRAREQIFQVMPPELAEHLLDYLQLGRDLLSPPGGDSPWLFFNHAGQKTTDYHIRRYQALLLEQYGKDIFPDGITIQRRRSLVATDCLTRFGWAAGLPLAARALVDAESTVAKYYVLREPDLTRLQPGEPTQAAAISAAYRAVTGRKVRATPLKPH